MPSRHSGNCAALVALGALLSLAAAAEAQVIGTFAWQTQPFCNVITVTVNQQGGLYQLTGIDNLCGAGSAPITGTAAPAGPGVALGFTAVLPNGRPVHIAATVSLATVSGTWHDSAGNTGPFTFGATATGSPRPAPPASPRVFFASITGTGVLEAGNVVSAARTFTGSYQVDLGIPPAGCAATVQRGSQGVGAYQNSGNGGVAIGTELSITTMNSTFALTDTDFHLIVVCP